LTFAVLSSPVFASEVTRPNIVVIVADDMGWADVGYHGSEIATPNIDALAESGVKLERHYVFPTCSPTRVALLTSRNPSRFGILGPISGRSLQALPVETLTLADLLKGRGYRTAIAGKWHLGLRPEVGPSRYGFESTHGYLHGQIDPYTHRYKNGDRTWHRQDQFLDEPGHATDLIAADAVRVIDEGRGKAEPFFLYVAFSVPHTPLNEEMRWRQPYEGKISEPSRLLYAAAVSHMDDAIGRIIGAVDRSGAREKTLILFLSDNGALEGSNEVKPRNYGGKYAPTPVLGNNRPLRGWKGQVFEGGIRVPAVVNWRGTLAPRTVHTPISVLDWMPTLAKLTGASVDPRERPRWEGIDVWKSVAEGEPGPVRLLYWKNDQWLALREGSRKLVVRVPRKTETAKAATSASPLLFNLADDPNETTDIANREPAEVARLLKLLREQQSLDPPVNPS
jgi:arylsulfatase A-like enzyme